MAIKFSTLAVLIMFYLASVFPTCRKDCSQTNYSFKVGIKAYPDLDSIRMGDTLWIEVDEKTELQDLNTLKFINYGGAANLGTVVAFQEIVGDSPQINDAAGLFSLSTVFGRQIGSVNPAIFMEFVFEERDGRFKFKIGLVPKKVGVFRINVGAAANVYRKNEECTKASFSYDFKDTHQHFYFYPGGTNTPSGGATYYFKVI